MAESKVNNENSGNRGIFSRFKLLFQKNEKEIGLALLLLYIILLGLGTIGEIWEVEWILDLPLFRPPGKY